MQRETFRGGGGYESLPQRSRQHQLLPGAGGLLQRLLLPCGGLAAGIDSLAYYSHELGLGKYTGLTDIYGEVEGVVASREYKMATFGERWYEAETMSAAIGQTYHNLPLCSWRFMLPSSLTEVPITVHIWSIKWLPATEK